MPSLDKITPTSFNPDSKFLRLADRAKKHVSKTRNMGIIEFSISSQGLNLSLLPSQRFYLKIFNKEELDNSTKDIIIRDQFNKVELYRFTELEYYSYLFEEQRISLDYDTFMKSTIIEYQLCWGRRATKSSTIGIYAAYKLYQVLQHERPQEYFGILLNDTMNVTMTALGASNAQKLFDKFHGIVKDSPFFKRFLREEPTSDSLRIWTEHDLNNPTYDKERRVFNSINVSSFPNSPGVRGDNNLIAIMDEAAHFNTSSKSTRDTPLDKSIYEALSPSVSGFKNPDGSPFGITLILSSPSGCGGFFYENYTKAFEMGPESFTLASRAPSWETNPTIAPTFLTSQYNKDPIVFDQEYGAKFLQGGVRWLKNLKSLYRCINTSLDSHRNVGEVDKKYFLGLDFALSHDGTAAAIAHFDNQFQDTFENFCQEFIKYSTEKELIEQVSRVKGRFVIDYAEVRYAGFPPWEDREVLQIEEVLEWIESLTQRFPIQYGTYDQWSGEIIDQLIKTKGLKHIEMTNYTQSVNDSHYKLFNSCLNEDNIRLPYDLSMITELLTLQVEFRAKDIIKVGVPPYLGHDDLFDAMIRALWLAFTYHTKNDTLATSLSGDIFHAESLIERNMGLDLKNAKLNIKKRQKLHQFDHSLRNPKNVFNNRG